MFMFFVDLILKFEQGGKVHFSSGRRRQVVEFSSTCSTNQPMSTSFLWRRLRIDAAHIPAYWNVEVRSAAK